MAAEERIARMERDGAISSAQAERLRASLRPTRAAAAPVRGVRRYWVYMLAALVALVSLGLVAILGSPDSPGPVQDVSRVLNDPGVHGTMNKTILNVVAAALLLLIPLALLALVYNGLVNREEAVFRSWAQVESQLQRRADLVPGLVEVVSQYARHERETLSEVTTLRGEGLTRSIEELTRSQQEISRLLDGAGLLDDQGRMDELARIQREAGTRITGFLALAEDYPQLRASDQFLELQAQLEGTENRINVARLQFNEAVGDFNASIRRLPGTLVAGLGDFRRKAYFKADASAAAGPAVDFGGQ